jgi:hypothetical protein
MEAAIAGGEVPGDTVSLRPWEELPEELKESDRAQARQMGEKLATIGCLMVPTFDPALSFAFDDDEVRLLARLEHERWMGGRTAKGVEHGTGQEVRMHPGLVPWEQLPDEARTKNMEAVRRLPGMLARVGFQVLRHDPDVARLYPGGPAAVAQ